MIVLPVDGCVISRLPDQRLFLTRVRNISNAAAKNAVMEKELIFDFVGDFSDHAAVLEPKVLLRQSE